MINSLFQPHLMLAIALILLIVVARNVHPSKNRSGHGLEIPASNEQRSGNNLRVATYNIQTGKNNDGKRDITLAASTLADVDIAGVQEVYARSWLNQFGIGQPQLLALTQTSKLGGLFAATRYRWFREHRGNALLSRINIDEWRIEMLPDQSRKAPRNMVVANLVWNNTPITFINTHLHTGRGKENQLRVVLEEFDKQSTPTILVGDFNTTSESSVMQDWLRTNQGVDAIKAAELEADSPSRIDWILTKGFSVIGGTSQPIGVSDHPYFEVTLRLSEPSSF